MKRTIPVLLAVLALAGCTETPEKETAAETPEKLTPVFEKVDAATSGVEFTNRLKHDVGSRANLFDYDYFYNGAGVGLEDLNNDGLLDIFFCANQEQDQLYFNRGELQFEDVSQAAGIQERSGWSTGVSFVDINSDGWMDIYVSRGGPHEPELRANLLYINQGDGSFKEEAAAYGLADTGISTQSAFFDFDRDGDLDCIVMNENELYGVDPINLYRILEKNPSLLPYNSSHLYRNDNGRFVDVTKEAGIERPIFGLGLAISDINSDGWLDIYIASDYYIPDALFINRGDGTFTDEIKTHTRQVSYYGMGIDIADINNDQKQDIFVLDMASSDHVRSKTLMASMSTARFDYLVNKAEFHYQYMYNSLQLNIGDHKFNNIAQLAGVGNTDWSWAVILSDFDQDEQKDIFISNGYRRYALDNDLQMKVFEARQKYRGKVPLQIKSELYESMPSEKLANILYRNKGELEFENVAQQWGLGDLTFSNGAASGDLDNDGDLDLVINNMDENALVYKNKAVEEGLGNYLKVETEGLLSEDFARIAIYYDGKSQFVENRRVRGYMSSLENSAHFGLGETETLDSVVVSWPGGRKALKTNVSANSTILFKEAEAKTVDRPENAVNPLYKKLNPENLGLDFVHRENYFDDFETEILLPYKQSEQGPFMAKADVDNNGLEDLFIGGASGQAGALYLQKSSGFVKSNVPAFETDRSFEDMEAVFFDLEGDGDLDLYVVSGGNEFEEFSSYYTDRIYINDGRGNYSRGNMEALSVYPKSGKSVVAVDFDQDGDQDIVVGNRIIPKSYPNYAPSTLYRNDKGVLTELTADIAPDLLEIGIVNKIIASDFNNDGWTDLVIATEWGPVSFLENTQGNFRLLNTEAGNFTDSGWWFSVHETDVNNDGLKDYIAGNVGLNIKFKASREKPFKIYAADFDDNGTHDLVLSKKYHDTYVPVRGRECSSQQMPFIKEKFPTYSEFANASLSEIYGEKLAQSYESEVTEFRSVLLINKGGGNFEKRLLPVEAQIFPVLDVALTDLNQDGFEDLILAGNIYETEVETPRLDAFSGLVLLSNGQDGYLPQPYSTAGLYLEGNVKSIELLRSPGGEFVVHTANNGPLGLYQLN